MHKLFSLWLWIYCRRKMIGFDNEEAYAAMSAKLFMCVVTEKLWADLDEVFRNDSIWETNEACCFCTLLTIPLTYSNQTWHKN